MEVLIHKMLFANDSALTLHNEAGLQQMVDHFSHACKEFGLTISLKKTNNMAQDNKSPSNITISGCFLEMVHTFTYLKSTIYSSLSLDAEVSSRITKAATIMAKLNSRVSSNNQLIQNTKLHAYQACVLSTLPYGSTTWTMYASQEKRLNSFHLCCLRCIPTNFLTEQWPLQRSLNVLASQAYSSFFVIDISGG